MTCRVVRLSLCREPAWLEAPNAVLLVSPPAVLWFKQQHKPLAIFPITRLPDLDNSHTDYKKAW
jgi:hypothetical protein